MLSLLSITLILCLLATFFLWVSDYVTRARGPQLVPYFNEQGITEKYVHNPISEVPFFWDFWPDGEFQCVVSAQDLQDSRNLATNWVLETTRDSGTTRARSWQKGHELRWRCLGTIECHGQTCPIELAPAPRAVDCHKQLGQLCICRETLRLRDSFTHSSMRHPNGSMVLIDYVPKHGTSSIQIAEPNILPLHSGEHSSGFYETRIIDKEVPFSDDIELNSDEQQEVEDDPEADEQDQLDEY
ncbi:hypothetical protein B0H14DRAFT_2656818 [Mycena olivaceomarginata]|nr:hypothetical protein B0H14DRAFT_2656818 [Mycena olivaceomarginata]